MELVEMERSDGGGSVKKTKVGNEIPLCSIGALDPPRRPSLHAHRCRSNSNRPPGLPYLLGNNRGL
ncbi:hypothetical protein TIFTF001_016995 [Ficus carica]|uniref:Uncharacterized protein n=1 Tax=Ficus carica TaxID=3494 RepID=A0AA88DIY3_FICCA|nr:hypothetical protein TIFTF001_016995 [Ficus carica]